MFAWFLIITIFFPEQSAFATYDIDIDHALSSTELTLALYNLDVVISDEAVEKLMYRHGMENEKILFEDFIFCALKIKKLMQCFSNLSTKAFGCELKFTFNNWMKTLYFA
jgi:hypothetical protein